MFYNLTVRQFYRYLWVGGIAFVIDAGLLLLLVKLNLYYIIANTIAFLVANVFNFFAAHYFVFGKKSRFSNLYHIYTFILIISTVGLLLNDAILYIAVDFMSLSLLFSKVLATALVLIWNFSARKRWVYSN